MYQYVGKWKSQVPLQRLDSMANHIHVCFGIAWTALCAEGFGCNLQHFTFLPDLNKEVFSTFGIPESYVPKAQLVFGSPTTPPLEKEFAPIDDRVFVKGL